MGHFITILTSAPMIILHFLPLLVHITHLCTYNSPILPPHIYTKLKINISKDVGFINEQRSSGCLKWGAKWQSVFFEKQTNAKNPTKVWQCVSVCNMKRAYHTSHHIKWILAIVDCLKCDNSFASKSSLSASFQRVEPGLHFQICLAYRIQVPGNKANLCFLCPLFDICSLHVHHNSWYQVWN